MRKRTRLSTLISSDQMNLAPVKSCSKNGSFGPTTSSVYSLALGHLLSSKSMANQSSGRRMFSTRGFFVSPSTGPHENFFAFHVALVTVPSPNFRMNPPSPMFVLAYSMPVFGSALSIPMTAIVMGYAGRISTETTLCGTKAIESTATSSPLM